MRSVLVFILLIFFGFTSEPDKKSPHRPFGPADASSLKAKIQGKKLLHHQNNHRTTTKPFQNERRFLNHLKKIGKNDEYYDYGMPEDNPYFPDYDGHEDDQQWIHHPNFPHMEEYPDKDYSDEPDYSDMDHDLDFPDRRRADKKPLGRQLKKSNDYNATKYLVRKETQQPGDKVGLRTPNKSWFWRKKNKKPKIEPATKGKGSANKNNIDENAKWKYQRKNFNKKPKKTGYWWNRSSYRKKYKTTEHPNNKWLLGREKISNNEMKPFNYPGKPSKLKGFKSDDINDFNNRLKKSINDSSPEGITYFPADTAGPKIPELPTVSGMMAQRNGEIKRQAAEEEQDLSEEPPNDLKPGAFKAEMFHERVNRNGSLGNEDANEKLSLEKRRVIANNPARRKRKHVEAEHSMKQHLPIKKRRLVRKDVASVIPQYIPTTTNSSIHETTILDAPTTLFGTEPPITGEAEPPTTSMLKKREDNGRFVGPKFQNQIRGGSGSIYNLTNQQLENFYEQNGMHLVKLIYRIKEQELESIFDILNMSTSTELGFTTPALEDVVKMQSSMIQQLVKTIDDKQNRKTQSQYRVQPSHSKERNAQNETKDDKNVIPDSDLNNNVSSGIVQKRFKIPGTEPIGNSNLNADNLQHLLQLYQLLKSKNNAPTTASSRPATDILVKNLLKNPAILQQLLSRNANKNSESTAGWLTPSLLQLLAKPLLKTADKVEKNELIDKDKATEEKVLYKENQNLDGKLSKMFGDNQKSTPTENPEKDLHAGEEFSSTVGNTSKKDDKKANAEKLKHYLMQILKNPSLVRRSSINRRLARESLLKSKLISDRSSELTTTATTNINGASTIASDVSKTMKNLHDQTNNASGSSNEDTDEDDEDENAPDSNDFTISSVSATTGTEDDFEDGDEDFSTEGAREDSVESETNLTEKDTLLPTAQS